MQIRSAFNGGTADVSDEQASKLIATGHWTAVDGSVAAPAASETPAASNPPVKRKRRTKAEMAAARAAEAAAKTQE
ncbi:hypothetical protein SEA_ELEPHANTOON_18 [Mycobacterium phage Elephantoon]|nr:hypothetical protein SEA_ELEPHANTOON_18 [Mycobacterium phage Elephantoon]